MSTAAIRADLGARVAQWRLDLPPDDEYVGTMGYGIIDKAKERVEILVHGAVGALAPDAKLRAKPYLSDYIEALVSQGVGLSPTCLGEDGPMLTDADIATLERFRDARNRIAHPDDASVEARLARGGPDASETHRFLDLVDAVMRLKIFDEVVCREEHLAPTAPDDRAG